MRSTHPDRSTPFRAESRIPLPSPHASKPAWEAREGDSAASSQPSSKVPKAVQNSRPESYHPGIVEIEGRGVETEFTIRQRRRCAPFQRRATPWFRAPYQRRATPWTTEEARHRKRRRCALYQRRATPWFRTPYQRRATPWFHTTSHRMASLAQSASPDATATAKPDKI